MMNLLNDKWNSKEKLHFMAFGKEEWTILSVGGIGAPKLWF